MKVEEEEFLKAEWAGAIAGRRGNKRRIGSRANYSRDITAELRLWSADQRAKECVCQTLQKELNVLEANVGCSALRVDITSECETVNSAECISILL